MTTIKKIKAMVRKNKNIMMKEWSRIPQAFLGTHGDEDAVVVQEKAVEECNTKRKTSNMMTIIREEEVATRSMAKGEADPIIMKKDILTTKRGSNNLITTRMQKKEAANTKTSISRESRSRGGKKNKRELPATPRKMLAVELAADRRRWDLESRLLDLATGRRIQTLAKRAEVVLPILQVVKIKTTVKRLLRIFSLFLRNDE